MPAARNGPPALIALVLLAAGACGGAVPVGVRTLSLEELARHYAPIIRQGAASDQDYITGLDFDGDWVSNNNWQNQPTGDLSARVYYSVAETETHVFLFYALFHPRDYIPGDCAREEGCHENDMEALQLIVAKDGSAHGRLLAVTTLAHGDLFLYAVDPDVRSGTLALAGQAVLQEHRPTVFVETYGHGIYGRPIELLPASVTYVPGEEAGRPRSIREDGVPYQLVPIYETLWARRHDMVGPVRTFDRPFRYRGHLLPMALDGDDYGRDRANTPWGYDQGTAGVLSRGDWFLDPAQAFHVHARLPGPVSTRYLHNPYLADLLK